MGRLKLGLQHAVEPILCGLVEVVAGFVQEQERRIGAHGDRQEQALPLPAREAFKASAPHGIAGVQVMPGVVAPCSKFAVHRDPFQSAEV